VVQAAERVQAGVHVGSLSDLTCSLQHGGCISLSQSRCYQNGKTAATSWKSLAYDKLLAACGRMVVSRPDL